MLSACLTSVPVCTGVTGTGVLLPVFDGAAGPTGTGFTRMIRDGAPATAGTVILFRPVVLSRTAFSTGIVAEIPPVPVLTRLIDCRPLPSSEI
ncbi:hypothetical protein BOQ07_28885 [Klebsiella michiganensis]|nr:hypothetical protein BOQ07_28885 [Klebsiella michiganensis]